LDLNANRPQRTLNGFGLAKRRDLAPMNSGAYGAADLDGLVTNFGQFKKDWLSRRFPTVGTVFGIPLAIHFWLRCLE